MRLFLSKVIWVALLLPIAGCESMSPTPEWEKAANEILASQGDLNDALSNIHDAASAQAAVPGLEAKFARALTARNNFVPFQNNRNNMFFDEYEHRCGDSEEQKVANNFRDKAKDLDAKFRVQIKRLESVGGLPREFWRIVQSQCAEKELNFREIMYKGRPDGDTTLDMQRSLKGLLSKEHCDETVKVEFINLWSSLTDKAYKKLKQGAPDVKTTLHFIMNEENVAYMSPVKDFQKFAAAADFGKVIIQDEAQRMIRVVVDPEKLGATGKTDEEQKAQNKKAEEKAEADRKAQFEKEWRDREKESNRREKQRQAEERGPLPGDPKYFESLAERMLSKDSEKQNRAIDALLDIDPAQVPSAETRAKIARGFKTLAEEKNSNHAEKAVKGLVIWGGKYSGPILLKLLENSRHFTQEAVIAALGELKQPEAAPALAALLGKSSLHDEAYKALLAMGSVAEDALIKVAPSEEERVCLDAIKLLGEVGTEKSLPVLRQAAASPKSSVRDAVKVSIRKINARMNKNQAEKIRNK